MSDAASTPSQTEPPDPRRWVVLAIGMFAMTAACAFQFGMAYLIPTFRAGGLSLAQAGLLAAAPTAGLLTTLIAWGAAADRWGERIVLSTGLGLSAVALLVTTQADDAVKIGVGLFVAGAAGAAAHASSGRLIMGWFGPSERGLAMGLRQTAQPAGVAVAALVLPTVGAHGIASALVFLAVINLVGCVLVAVLVRDPERGVANSGEKSSSPYRQPILWRIHAASALLIVPQFAVATFALTFLVDAHGLTAASAGRLLAAAQVGGAAARLGVGWWSDRVGSRLRPMRMASLAVLGVAGVLTVAAHSPVGIVAVLVASVVTVTPNGLAFTAVAEHAGRSWSGRALGIQNTAQNAVASATPPLLGLLVSGLGFRPAFAVMLPCALLASMVIPVAAERGAGPRPVAAPTDADLGPVR